MNKLLLGRFPVEKSALFVCDMQEKFASGIKYFPQIVANSKKLLESAKIMDIPVVYTEQYPKGLGHTVPELNITEYSKDKFEKLQFSMMTPELMKHLKGELKHVNTVVLCGIETHACIRHTAIDLIDQGFNVHVVVDACSSRTMVDRKYALKAIERMGANLTTTESAIFGYAPDAGHPKFRMLRELLLQPSADTGL
ncbi:hypothetical protein OUZ56_009232 [Daphnia magna]|uniref:Isochorismatase-like domain-containing protein n=1 Tax=Daphnia magna TaxID=35525 RepID=A0ABR0AFE0_9CRUS|nr:hypothetical protein OUZ56_009232 [Daphnia magna]